MARSRFVNFKNCALFLGIAAIYPISPASHASSKSDETRYLTIESKALGTPDVMYSKLIRKVPMGIAHVVRFNLMQNNFSLSVSPPSARGKTPSTIARLQGSLVSVNGSFFDEKMQALGLVIGARGTWPGTKDSRGYHVFSCTSSNTCAIELSKGKSDGHINGISPEVALSGRPLLVKNGAPRTPKEDESCRQFCANRHPRSGVGLSKERKELILVVVEGRQSTANGATLAEFGNLMTDLGAHDAINLDGGGSSTLVIAGKLASGRPVGETEERRVANVLSIVPVARAKPFPAPQAAQSASPRSSTQGVAIPISETPKTPPKPGL